MTSWSDTAGPPTISLQQASQGRHMSPQVPAEHRRATRAFWWGWLPSGLCVLLLVVVALIAVLRLARRR
jgi:hypothetical protein